MIEQVDFEAIVAQARLAPSVHNTQPARWRLNNAAIDVLCDTSVGLTVGDPQMRDAGLSCGAAVEATVLALQARGLGCQVTELWDISYDGPLRPVARIDLRGAAKPDPLAEQLEHRFTHRGPFGAKPLRDWARSDMVLLTDAASKDWLARLNDRVSLSVMTDDAFRAELLSWMRLSEDAPEYGQTGMSSEAMRMTPFIAGIAGRVLGPWWSVLHRFGLTRFVVAEAKITRGAAAIACFHRAVGESDVEVGRAYLRLWLEATQRGTAGWPMASLADSDASRAEICDRLGLREDRRLVQVLRFGAPDQPAPPRARRPVTELIV